MIHRQAIQNARISGRTALMTTVAEMVASTKSTHMTMVNTRSSTLHPPFLGFFIITGLGRTM